MKRSSAKSHGVVGFGSVLGFVGTEEIFGAAAEAGDVPGKAGFLDRLLYAGGPALGEGDHAVEGFLG